MRGPDLELLDANQRATYLEMVGPDGWCIHFDTGGRRCRIYESRPDFCRVENLVALFSPDVLPPTCTSDDAEARDQAVVMDRFAEDLAIASCRTQIRAEYGGRGRVMRRFERAIRREP